MGIKNGMLGTVTAAGEDMLTIHLYSEDGNNRTLTLRAKVLREHCYRVLEEYGKKDDPYMEMAIELERIALEDEYFLERRLYPNVDFYSGLILKTIGFPISMFTPQFAVARTIGWVSHWNEMMADEDNRIVRPRQLYMGNQERPVKSVTVRNADVPIVG